MSKIDWDKVYSKTIADHKQDSTEEELEAMRQAEVDRVKSLSDSSSVVGRLQRKMDIAAVNKEFHKKEMKRYRREKWAEQAEMSIVHVAPRLEAKANLAHLHSFKRSLAPQKARLAALRRNVKRNNRTLALNRNYELLEEARKNYSSYLKQVQDMIVAEFGAERVKSHGLFTYFGVDK